MMNMQRKKSDGLSEEEITQLFRDVDLDGDGFISPKEAKRAYKKLSKSLKLDSDPVRQKANFKVVLWPHQRKLKVFKTNFHVAS